MSSVRAIAKQVGVSISTVSRALNDSLAVNPQTRERVLRAAKRFDYTPASRRVSSNLALCYTQHVTISEPFDVLLTSGMMHGAEEDKLDLVIINLQRDKKPDETYTQLFRRKGCSGALLRSTFDTRHVCLEIADECFPHVVINDRFDAPNVNFVDFDLRQGVRRAIEYLFSLGHDRIVLALRDTTDHDHHELLAGYQDALREHGAPHNEQLIFRHPHTLEGGAAALNLAISMTPRPTALFFTEPMSAVGAAKRAHALGVRVPDDLSIVSVDDHDARRLIHPTLTAVCQDARRIGYEAALWLTRSLNRKCEPAIRKVFPTYFEVNQSTAAVRTEHPYLP